MSPTKTIKLPTPDPTSPGHHAPTPPTTPHPNSQPRNQKDEPSHLTGVRRPHKEPLETVKVGSGGEESVELVEFPLGVWLNNTKARREGLYGDRCIS
ncbi:hypothetical protein GCM10020229_13380 [Kitasatospora albolonga]